MIDFSQGINHKHVNMNTKLINVQLFLLLKFSVKTAGLPILPMNLTRKKKMEQSD